MALNILIVYSLKCSTCLYQHFLHFLSVTKEEVCISYQMPVSLYVLWGSFFLTFTGTTLLYFFCYTFNLKWLFPWFFPFMKNMIPEDPHWSKVSSSYFSVSLHISLDPVSSSFKYLLSALSLLDIHVPDFSIHTSSLFKRIIMFLPPVSTF